MGPWLSAFRGEWCKLASLRSTWLTLGSALAVAGGLGYGHGLLLRDYEPFEGGRDLDPFFVSSLTLVMAMLALVAFSALATAGEYSAHTMQTSLLAVPHRATFYLAKLAAAAGFAVAAVIVMVPASFVAAQAGLGDTGVGFDEPGAVEVLVGSVVFLSLMAVFALGVGAMLRSSALTLGILMPLLFLSSQGLGNLPAIQEFTQYLPDQGGQVIMHIVPQDDPRFAKDYGPWTGLGIVALWALAANLGGWIVTRRTEV